MKEVWRPLSARSSKQSALVARAQTLVPGGTLNMSLPPDGLEIIVERGDGPYIYDVDGRRFLDCSIGGGSQILGHAHPRIVAAVQASVINGSNFFTMNRRALELVERIVSYVPSAEMVRFTHSGSEATFGALRLARAVTRRRGIVKFDGAYHGSHDLAVWSFGRAPEERSLSGPIRKAVAESAGTQRGVAEDLCILPFNSAEAVKRAMRAAPRRFAAVICEPFQRNLSPIPGFLETLREECDRAGTVLIFDEVVTGFRWAPGGAQQKYGVTPDLTTLGKAMSGGLPMAALVGKRQFMMHLDPKSPSDRYSILGGTHNGYLLAMETAHVALDILIEEDGIGRLHHLGELMRQRLQETFANAGVTVQMCGEGPLFHPYFIDRPVRSQDDVRASDWQFNEAYHRKLREAGVHKTFEKGYLSLAHTEDQVDEFCVASQWALQQLRNGKAEQRLQQAAID